MRNRRNIFLVHSRTTSIIYKISHRNAQHSLTIYTLYTRYFERPDPSVDIVQKCVDRLRREILDTLRHKGPEQKLSIEFRHDVFQFLFHGFGKAAEQKQWTLFESKDFSRCKFPDNWNYLLNHHGDGVKTRFPVKMRTFLSRSPTQSYVEKISLIIVKISYCS